MSDKSIAARTRNFKIFRLRSLWRSAHLVQAEDREAFLAIVDRALIALNAEPETVRRNKFEEVLRNNPDSRW